MTKDRLETCRHFTPVDQSVEDMLHDKRMRAALEGDGVQVEDLTDLISAIRTRVLAQRWRNAA